MFAKKTAIPLFILFSLVVVLGIYWWGYQSPNIGIDDANIYFVYMKNFAEGHGFVWNVGNERVEGFTSLLWTLIGAFAYSISPTYFNIILLMINFLLIFLSLRSVLLFSRKLNGTEQQHIAASDIIIVSLLVLPLGFLEWGIITLMETGLWTFLLVHLTLQLCSFFQKDIKFNPLTFSVMIILLDMTRPESMALSLLFIGILFIIRLTEKREVKPALKEIAFPLTAHLVTVFSVILWRLSYFGYPFPNTYYAKVSGDFWGNVAYGMRYLFEFFYSYPHAAFVVALLLLFLILLVSRLHNRNMLSDKEKIVAVLLTVVFTGLALPVLTGGDHFRYSRFYQPFLPLMYLAVTCSFLWKEYIGLRIEHRKLALRLVLPVVFGALFFSKFTVFDFMKNRNSVNYNILVDFSLAHEGRKLGDNLNDTFGDFKYPSLGALATGGVGYSYKGKTIDLLGLNNTTMAHASNIKTGYRNHASFDKNGFWQLKPDILGTFIGANVVEDTLLFVLPENTKNFRSADFTYLCFKGIFDDADFRESYLPALVKNKAKNYFVFSYYNKEFLSLLNNNGNYVVKILERKALPPNHAVYTKR